MLTEPEASFSVLALTLAHGVNEGNFPQFHRSVFEKVQASEHKLTSNDLFDLADASGLSREAFAANRSMLVELVRQDYEEASERWKVHGTPTIVFNGKSSVYFRFDLEGLPGPEGWDVIDLIAKSPWLLEAKRSS